jgi:DNA-binding transcriptional regulator YiaG
MLADDLAFAMRTIAALQSGEARKEREALGVRQIDMAGVLGVTRQAVSQWEAGVRRPSAAHALDYGRTLEEIAENPAAFL